MYRKKNVTEKLHLQHNNSNINKSNYNYNNNIDLALVRMFSVHPYRNFKATTKYKKMQP